MSWPNFSVREVGRDQVGLARAEVLLLHLLSVWRNLSGHKPGEKRGS